MNKRMKECLRRAAQDGCVQDIGREMNPHHEKIVMDASLKMGARGFGKSTLWRALEIATEEEPGE